MWPWWERIPTENFTDVTLVSEDTDDCGESAFSDNLFSESVASGEVYLVMKVI